MIIRLFFIFIFLFSSSILFAKETCPTPNQIHSNLLNNWHAYTNDNGTDLTPEELVDFENTIGAFTYAAWLENAPEGESHCYYFNNQGDYAIAFLSKNNLIPDPNSANWTSETGNPTCKSALTRCIFYNKNY